MKTLSLEGAAAHLNVSPDTMRDLAANGDVAGAKIGKAWVFTDEALEEYIREEIRQQTAGRRPALASVERVIARMEAAEEERQFAHAEAEIQTGGF